MNGMAINPTPQGGGAYPLGQSEGAAVTKDVSALSQQVVEELQQKVLQYVKGQQAGVATPGVTDGNGAPEIDGVVIAFTAEDLGDALRLLGNKTKEQQLKAAKESLETSKLKMSESHKKAITKIEEYAKKCAEAKHQAKVKSIFGWIGRALAFVGAAIAVGISAVATVASGGAATPALVLSCVALAAATISLASAVSQECGGPALEPSSLMTKAISAALKLFGVPPEKAESIGKVASGVLGIVMTSGAALLIDPAFASNVVAGGMELGGVDPDTISTVTMIVGIATTVTVGLATAIMTFGAGSASAVSNAVGQSLSTTAQAVQKGAAVAQGVTTVATGVSGTVSAGAGIAEAKTQHDADMALVDKKKIDTIIVALMKAMEEDSEEIKKILKEIEESMQAVSDIISGSAQSLSDIAANIKGGRAAV